MLEALLDGWFIRETVRNSNYFSDVKILVNKFFLGIFELKVNHKSPPVVKRITHIGMIAGGTGITPMFQLIKDICYHKEDKTKLSL